MHLINMYGVFFTIFFLVWDEALHWHGMENWAVLTDFGQESYQRGSVEEWQRNKYNILPPVNEKQNNFKREKKNIKKIGDERG